LMQLWSSSKRPVVIPHVTGTPGPVVGAHGWMCCHCHRETGLWLVGDRSHHVVHMRSQEQQVHGLAAAGVKSRCR
jgi:hypothetical protein